MNPLERSVESAINENLFTRYRNTIDIYTEDEEKDKIFYRTLFSRLLDDANVKINDITPLGSCDDVTREWLLTKDKRKKFFIIDGDINVVLSPKAKDENLYVLERYCIENYVVDENAFVEMFSSLSGVYSEEKIKSLLDINAYLTHFALYVVPLFLHFAIVYQHGCKFKIPQVGRYCDENWDVRKDEIDKIIQEGWDEIEAMPNEKLNEELSALSVRYHNDIDTMLKVVCGKDIIKYIKCKCDYTFKTLGEKELQYINIPEKGWKAQMAKYADLSALEGLKQAIVNASRNQS